MELSDKRLAFLAQNGDERAAERLLVRYGAVAVSCSKKFFCDGYAPEDLAQEATIGLYKAIMTYKPELNDNFKPYAIMCIRARLITIVEFSKRKRRIPPDVCVSIDAPPRTDEKNIAETIQSPEATPETRVLRREHYRILKNRLTAKLSPFEAAVLRLLLGKKSYKEIARRLNSDTKSIDNAIQRIRKKLKSCF